MPASSTVSPSSASTDLSMSDPKTSTAAVSSAVESSQPQLATMSVAPNSAPGTRSYLALIGAPARWIGDASAIRLLRRDTGTSRSDDTFRRHENAFQRCRKNRARDDILTIAESSMQGRPIALTKVRQVQRRRQCHGHTAGRDQSVSGRGRPIASYESWPAS